MGGVVVCTWWWWGCVFAQHEVQSGFGPKKLKLSCHGSVSSCSGAAESGEGCCGVTAPPPMLN